MTETRPIRSFHPRRGRMSARHHDAHAALWPRFGFEVEDGDRAPLDLAALFGRAAPVVLEIGFGMGDTTAAMAAVDPGRDYLAVEVHTPGIANLLALIGEQNLPNVRVARADAMQLVHKIERGSLDAVHVFFPDPWPKARHHKRRLIRAENVALLRERLRPGGVLHCATDWPHYAASMAEVLDADPGLIRASAAGLPAAGSPSAGSPAAGLSAARDDLAAGPSLSRGDLDSADRDLVGDRAGRPETKFERRGVAAGRPIADLRYLRRP
jgi:tRNA (guanine-N7-)-methyltransferase